MCKIFKAYTHETVLYLTINPRKQKTNQTKTKLSPQGPQRSRHSVARERRRGDRPPTENVIWGIYIWSM
jgi:predicted metalloprotease